MNRLTRLPLLMMLACISIVLLSCSGADDGSGSISSKGVEQIFSENCVNCHNNNSVGTFSLALDENGKQNAETYKKQIKTTVLDKTMPPWLVDGEGSCNTFSNDKSMSNGEINAIAAWVDAGGTASSLGSAQPPPPLPKLDPVNLLSVEMTENFNPAVISPEIGDVHRCFVIDVTGDQSGKAITGFEVVPGNPKIVHHLVLYSVNTDSGVSEAQAKDTKDTRGPGYECFGDSGLATGISSILASWTPGQGASYLPAGTGIEISSTKKLIMQIHYGPAADGYAVPDKTSIILKLDELQNITPAYVIAFAKLTFDSIDTPGALPIEQSSIVQTHLDKLKDAPWEVLGILPHMHNFGTSLHLEKIAASSGQSSCLMDVPIWDFEWQQFFFYSKNSTPIVIGNTDQVKITCAYDTTSAIINVANGSLPDEEMCAAYFYVIKPIPI